MKGLIVVPPFSLISAHVDRFPILFNIVKNRLGFEIQTTDNLNIPSDIDVVISYGKSDKRLFNLKSRIKLIVCQVDSHPHPKIDEKAKLKLFNRADVLLIPNDEKFRARYPQYISKYIFFPRFFAPYKRFASFELNKDPKLKCLLSGATSTDVYPIRHLVKVKGDPSKIDDYTDPIGKYKKKQICPWKYAKDDYAKLLNSYFCCVTCSSAYHYVVGKYLEIPATGSLLIADECNDSKKMGFIPYEHYIPITKENVFEKISECLKYPEKYREVREKGMKFVREHHSVNNRYEQLKNILSEI